MSARAATIPRDTLFLFGDTLTEVHHEHAATHGATHAATHTATSIA